jgi:phosphatidylethanolamine/phosphatidyl-N-methylethanolamine N-methyltransferase
MAKLVDGRRPGPILELGAGTGSITRSLIDGGWPPERIIAYERESRLAEILHREFRGIRAVVGDATNLETQLSRLGIDRLAAVVSSLPIKWFSLDAQRAVLCPCFARLGDGGQFLQMTNAFSSPLPIDRLGLAGEEAVRVWRNVPPAQIWAYSLKGPAHVQGMP